MTDNLTPNQTLVLFGLLARAGACAQSGLMPRVSKPDREALGRAKLCVVRKQGRSLFLTLTDSGWAWAAAHLTADLPPAQRTLADLLQRLDGYVKRSGTTLADIIGSGEATATSSATAEAKKAKSKATSAARRSKRAKGQAFAGKAKKTKSETSRTYGRETSPPSVRERIETAYLSLTDGRKNESVRLSKLREALADIDRATLDAALGQILKGDATASLLRNDDPKQLTRADHDAAYVLSGEPHHVLWISS